LVFFANNDNNSIPELYVVDPAKKDTSTLLLDFLGEDAILIETVFCDLRRKKALCFNQGEEPILALYDLYNKKLDFKMNFDEPSSSFQTSIDKKYFVAYDGQVSGDTEEDKQGSTDIKVYSLVNKKMFLLYLMKKACVTVKGEKRSLLSYYGHPYVAQQVADMFSSWSLIIRLCSYSII